MYNLEQQLTSINDADKLWLLQQLSASERQRLLKRINILNGSPMPPMPAPPEDILPDEAKRLLLHPPMVVAIVLQHGDFDWQEAFEQLYPTVEDLQRAKEKAQTIKAMAAQQLFDDFIAGVI